MATEAKNPTSDDDTSSTATESAVKVPHHALSAVKSFIGEHGGTGNVVIQHIGRCGTRVTLVGADGVLGDQVVESNEIAHALVDAVDGLTESEWDRELVSAVNPAPGHYNRMAGWVAGQKKFPKARNARLEN
ncbi:MAG: hypothetical protein WBQ44_18270 [Rhodococcus sp. (in: high G+C Gram-positive bacteria)]